MKRSISCFTLILLCGFVLASCGKKSDAPGGAAGGSTEAPAGSKYSMKAGIGEGYMEMMGQKLQMKLAFDDFGAKSSSEMSGEMMGQKMHQLTITKDGYTYQLDLTKNTGSKHKSNERDNMDFRNMTPEQMKAQGIMATGADSVINGKECKVYTIDPSANQKTPSKGGPEMKGRVWIWNGIPMKMEMGTMMKMEMTKMETSAPASSAFDVPADVKVSELPENPPAMK